jgi:hypothetical protein
MHFFMPALLPEPLQVTIFEEGEKVCVI